MSPPTSSCHLRSSMARSLYPLCVLAAPVVASTNMDSTMRRTNFSLHFADEYLMYASVANLSNDHLNRSAQPRGFSGHRHDQSIFSLLIKRYRLKTFPCVTQALHRETSPTLLTLPPRFETSSHIDEWCSRILTTDGRFQATTGVMSGRGRPVIASPTLCGRSIRGSRSLQCT